MCIDVLIQSYGYNEIVKNEEQFHCVSSVLGLGLWPRLKGLTGHDSEASYTLHDGHLSPFVLVRFLL